MNVISSTQRLLVTAALPYSNADIHVGHIAGAYLPADIFVRFKRLRGVEVRFISGSDDHGVPILLSAQKAGTTPDQIAKHFHDRQAADFAGLKIAFDYYGSTSQNPHHTKTSQEFFLKMLEQGFFEKQSSRQFFDTAKQMFLPDRFVKGTCGFCSAPDQYGDQCEQCGKLLDVDTLKDPRSTVSDSPAEIRETVHWFLDLTRFEKEVSTWLEGAALRDTTRSYVQGLVSTGLVKRSMTRDISWGVPVPLPSDPAAQNKVLYVWFDAPIGYVSNTKALCIERGESAEEYTRWWKSKECDIVHFIGEDNTVFHCVIWIAMLKAEGSVELPRSVVVNQFVNIQLPGKEVEKISKSRGTAVWIRDYLASGNNPDSLRYYLTAIGPERARSVYKPDDLIQRHNTDLANALGNFVHRIVSFTRKFVGNAVPEFPESKITDVDRAFRVEMEKTFSEVTELLEASWCRAALERVMEFCRACNRYVDEKAPWSTRKTDMETTQATLAHALSAIKFLAIMLAPFLPDTAEKMLATLSLSVKQLHWKDALVPLAAGTALEEPKILFAKIEGAADAK